MLDEALAPAPTPPGARACPPAPAAPGDAAGGPRPRPGRRRRGAEPADPVPVAATDPLYILYTSGTTGRPKGVVRDNGGHAVALRWSMATIFGISRATCSGPPPTSGWVVGHSYIVYAPLLTGATTVLYEGKPVGTPDAGAFWRVIEQHRVNVPLHRAHRHPGDQTAGPRRRADRRSTTCPPCGRCSWPASARPGDLRDWAGEQLGVPVIDNWWQTETGWPIAASPRGLETLPIKPGSPSVPVPGYEVRGRPRDGADVPAGRERLDRDPAAAAAGLPAHVVGRRRAATCVVPVGVPRLLPHRRRRPLRRRRLPLRDGPHRRHHQRGRAPAVHRRDGGGAGRASGCRRVRGDRRAATR